MVKLPMLSSDPHTYKGNSGIDFLRRPSKLGGPVLRVRSWPGHPPVEEQQGRVLGGREV